LNFGERLQIIPWHPGSRIVAKLLGVSLLLCHIVEEVYAVQLTGVNEAHVEVSHLRLIHSAVEECVLSMQDCLLERPFTEK